MRRSLWLVLCLACLLAGCARKAPISVVKKESPPPDPEAIRKAEVVGLLAGADRALEAREYETALRDYSEVLQRSPGHLDATAGKLKAENALFEMLVRTGKTELESKHYEQAIAHLSRARQLRARQLERENRQDELTQSILNDLINEAKREQTMKEMAYQRLLIEARDLRAARRFDEALKTLAGAQTMFPQDPAGQNLLNEVRKAQAEALTAEKVTKLVTAGRLALAAKNLDEAGKQLAEAQKLAPRDPAVLLALKDLETAIEQSPAGIARRKQRQEDYKLAMEAGRNAFNKENYPGAINSFTEALRLMPGDAEANDRLGLAQRLNNARIKKEQYTEKMKAGQVALAAKKYREAEQAFSEALKLMPADALALKGHGEAVAALKSETDRKQREAQHAALLKSARDAMTARRFDDAAKHLTEAQKLLPDDKDTAALLKEAQAGKSLQAAQEAKQREDFARLMAAGQTAMTGKKYPDAVKAYGDALKVFPRDAEARKGLDAANKAAEAAAREAATPRRGPIDKQKL